MTSFCISSQKYFDTSVIMWCTYFFLLIFGKCKNPAWKMTKHWLRFQIPRPPLVNGSPKPQNFPEDPFAAVTYLSCVCEGSVSGWYPPLAWRAVGTCGLWQGFLCLSLEGNAAALSIAPQPHPCWDHGCGARINTCGLFCTNPTLKS